MRRSGLTGRLSGSCVAETAVVRASSPAARDRARMVMMMVVTVVGRTRVTRNGDFVEFHFIRPAFVFCRQARISVMIPQPKSKNCGICFAFSSQKSKKKPTPLLPHPPRRPTISRSTPAQRRSNDGGRPSPDPRAGRTAACSSTIFLLHLYFHRPYRLNTLFKPPKNLLSQTSLFRPILHWRSNSPYP